MQPSLTKPWIDATLPNPKKSNISTTTFFRESGSSLKHPMRVAEPAQAKLIVVPTMNNMVFEAIYRDHEVCVKGCCDGHEILRRAANFLEKSIGPEYVQVRTSGCKCKPVFFT
jgi:hypothetical protein